MPSLPPCRSANGSGKSSLLRALAGVQAHAGRIAWDGGAAPAGSIGYMPQDTGAPVALTAFEVVLLGRMRSLAFRPGPTDLAAAEAAMAEIGVGDLAADVGRLERLRERNAGQGLLADRLVVEDRSTDGLVETGCIHN